MPAYAEFVAKYPEYDRTHDIDELRAREYGRLDELDQVYLQSALGGDGMERWI
jgi:hypothetical protein